MTSRATSVRPRPRRSVRHLLVGLTVALVAALTPDRRHRTRAGRAHPAVAGPAGHRLVHRERRHPRRRRRRRQHRHPLVQRVQRPAVAPGRPRRPGHHQPGRRCNWEAAYGHGVPDPDLRPTATHLDDDLLHHHRHRRHPDPHRHRHRPLRADVRHRPRHRLRLLAVGVPGLRRAPAAAPADLRHHQRRAGHARPPPRPPRTPAPPPSAAVDGNTGTRWSSAAADPQWLQVDLGAHPADLPGRAATGRPRTPRRSRSRPRPTAPPGPRSTPPPPAPAASQTLDRHRHRPLRADVRHRPRHRTTATRCGSSR